MTRTVLRTWLLISLALLLVRISKLAMDDMLEILKKIGSLYHSIGTGFKFDELETLNQETK